MISIEEHMKVLEAVQGLTHGGGRTWEEATKAVRSYIDVALKQLEVRKAQQGKLEVK